MYYYFLHLGFSFLVNITVAIHCVKLLFNHLFPSLWLPHYWEEEKHYIIWRLFVAYFVTHTPYFYFLIVLPAEYRILSLLLYVYSQKCIVFIAFLLLYWIQYLHTIILLYLLLLYSMYSISGKAGHATILSRQCDHVLRPQSCL